MDASKITKEDIYNWSTPDPNTGCWFWTHGYFANGYGRKCLNRKGWKAHRLSYFVFKGKMPDKSFVLHKCDTPACVNPEHLFLGNQSDNMKDMGAKKRGTINKRPHLYHKKGIEHREAILNEEQVKFIVKNYKPYHRDFGGYAMARRFGVGGSTVFAILKGRSWKHIK